MEREEFIEKLDDYMEYKEHGPVKDGLVCFNNMCIRADDILQVSVEEIKNYPTSLFEKFLFYYKLKKYSFKNQTEIAFLMKNGYGFFIKEFEIHPKLNDIVVKLISETLANWYRDYSELNFLEIIRRKMLNWIGNEIAEMMTGDINLFPYDLRTVCPVEELFDLNHEVYMVDIIKKDEKYRIITRHNEYEFEPKEEDIVRFEMLVSEMNRLKEELSPGYQEY